MVPYFVLMILTAWISMSLLIDVLAVPTVFRNISSLEEAGRVGMIIFKSFNSVEVFFGILLLVLGWCLAPRFKKALVFTWRFLLVFFLVLACFFRFQMTPKIIKLTHEMHQYELESEPYLKVNKEHQVYHKGYVKLEGVKLIMMLIALILFFYSQNLKLKSIQREDM